MVSDEGLSRIVRLRQLPGQKRFRRAAVDGLGAPATFVAGAAFCVLTLLGLRLAPLRLR